MNLRTDVLVIIPARSGSVGIANKNIRKVGKKSLLEWAIERALKVVHAENIIVSTDAMNYACIAQKTGVRVAKLRPNNLASGTSLIIDVVDHELEVFSKANPSNFCKIRYILLLEPSHFGSRSNIEDAIYCMDSNNNYNSIFGVYKVPKRYNFQKQYCFNKDVAIAVSDVSNYNRQDLKISFIRSGEFYLFRLSEYVDQRSLMPSPMQLFVTEKNSVNIDAFNDLRQARRIFDKLNQGPKNWK